MSSIIKTDAPYSQHVKTLASAPDKAENKPMEQQVSALADDKKIGQEQESIFVSNKKQLNAAIIESSLKFNTTIGDQPLSLVLKTALQGINEALKESGVDNSVEDAYESGVDFSPEATADRIISFSTQFLSSYREQHPEMSEEESLSAFVDIISDGIEQGFGEAKDILGGLNVLEGDITQNIDKTYELVQSGLKDFVDSFSAKKEEQVAQ
jgi:hypothetical protein